MDDRVVTSEFQRESRSQRRPEFVYRTWPVCKPIKRPSIAQHNGPTIMVADDFELTLGMINRPLRRAQIVRIILPRKPAADDNACVFGKDLHVWAEGSSN